MQNALERALDGGRDGLDIIRRLVDQAAKRTSPKGMVLYEIDSRQNASAKNIAREAFQESFISVEYDLSGKHRYVKILMRD